MKAKAAPRVSVIVPSHNRAQCLLRLLEGFEKQSCARDEFEVVVVLDGSSDGSETLLRRWQKAGRLQHLEWAWQKQQGQAAARNTGVARSSGRVLIFIDDDIVPSADFVAEHLKWFTGKRRRIAVLGPCPIPREHKRSWYDTVVWAWWEDMYHLRAQPGRIPGYRDFCAGNVSMLREDFLGAGGFDGNFRGYGGEDFDLGYRLQKRGVEFVSDPAAYAEHYHLGSAEKVLRNMRHEGHNDVDLGYKHPELRADLRLMRGAERMRVVFRFPRLFYFFLVFLRMQLKAYELLRLRGRWRRLFGRLRHCAYWRGVQDRLVTWKAYAAYRACCPAHPVCEVDISDGLPAKLPRLWANGAFVLAVKADGRLLGEVFVAEPLLGAVRPYLAELLTTHLYPQLWTHLTQKNIPLWQLDPGSRSRIC